MAYSITCPKDLNQFLIKQPVFENTFPKEECEQRKFYGDCYHCFQSAIAKRDQELKAILTKPEAPKIAHWISQESGDGSIHFMCDHCGKFEYSMSDFCPNCGYEMLEE